MTSSFGTTTADRSATQTPAVHPFVLSRPHGTVTGSGAVQHFDEPCAAAHALRRGAVDAVVGALAFRRDSACALTVPSTLTFDDRLRSSPLESPSSALPPFVVRDDIDRGENSAADHLDRVRTAQQLLGDPASDLEKVVLARRLELRAEDRFDSMALLSALVANASTRNGFHVDLSAAGGEYVGRTLVGSSPEVLIRRRGTTVTCHPLAGSAAREGDAEHDRAAGLALLESPKDLREHAFVVEALRESLGPLCAALDIPPAPTLARTPQLWHLGTPIRGELRQPDITALDLALALHPTPAVCGTPTELAYDTIAELEGDRGFYAGAVGWCTADGDGEWMVAIRCAEIGSDRRAVTAYAGGGIVAESDPAAELAETSTKFGTMLRALGVQL